MSDTRWRNAWKLAIATPNCLRVFMYSTVMAKVLSITPTASAHKAAMPMSTACATASWPLRVTNAAGALLRTNSAARLPSWVTYPRVVTPLAPLATRNKAIEPLAIAGTNQASAWSPAATTLLAPVIVQTSPAAMACVSQTLGLYRALRSWCASTTKASPPATFAHHSVCSPDGA